MTGAPIATTGQRIGIVTDVIIVTPTTGCQRFDRIGEGESDSFPGLAATVSPSSEGEVDPVSEYPKLDELIEGIRNRSDAAFSAVYRLTGDALASFAFSMLADRQAAEDAVQQAFLELVKAAPSIKGDGRSLRAWLFRSVRFTCLDEIRRRGRRPETPTASIPEHADVHAVLETPGMDADLENALCDLTERQRNLLSLRHVVGLSGSETAEIMDMSRPAAYAATARAEKRLRKLLGRVESGVSTASQPTRNTEKPT